MTAPVDLQAEKLIDSPLTVSCVARRRKATPVQRFLLGRNFQDQISAD